jgi:hypothetical protein
MPGSLGPECFDHTWWKQPSLYRLGATIFWDSSGQEERHRKAGHVTKNDAAQDGGRAVRIRLPKTSGMEQPGSSPAS